MAGRRQVRQEIDIRAPRKVLRILRAAEKETLGGQASRRLYEELFEYLLASAA
jgi:hypothetical protein